MGEFNTGTARQTVAGMEQSTKERKSGLIQGKEEDRVTLVGITAAGGRMRRAGWVGHKQTNRAFTVTLSGEK